MEILSNDILNKQKPPINVFLNSSRSLKKKRKWKSIKQGAVDTLTLSSPFSHLITRGWDFFFNCLENCLPGALSFLERNSLLIHNCSYSKAAWLPGIQPSSNSSTKAASSRPLSERPRHPQWCTHAWSRGWVCQIRLTGWWQTSLLPAPSRAAGILLPGVQ